MKMFFLRKAKMKQRLTRKRERKRRIRRKLTAKTAPQTLQPTTAATPTFRMRRKTSSWMMKKSRK